jgi:hypothetical protein
MICQADLSVYSIPTVALPSALSVRRTAFIRKREWHLWLQTYLSRLPESQRGAWVRTQETAQDSQSRLAMVRDVSMGGIKLVTRHRFESGKLLRVELWQGSSAQRALRVRVLSVRPAAGGEWLHSCTFTAEQSAA